MPPRPRESPRRGFHPARSLSGCRLSSRKSLADLKSARDAADPCGDRRGCLGTDRLRVKTRVLGDVTGLRGNAEVIERRQLFDPDRPGFLAAARQLGEPLGMTG